MMIMSSASLTRALLSLFLLQGALGLKYNQRNRVLSSMHNSILSVDLVSASSDLLAFLKDVHTSTRGALYQKSPALDCAVRRYKSGWIPVLKKLNVDKDENKKAWDPTELVPPVDVAWIWHVHRLNPNAYAKFVEQEGIDHEIFDAAFEQQSSASEHSAKSQPLESAATQQLWEQVHGNNMSFFMDTAATNCDAPNSMEETLPSSFLEGASVRQSKFLWNFLTPDYQDHSKVWDFLKETEGRYMRWLELKQKNPREQLVPTVPVDLMWHAHMLGSPDSYKQDIQRVGLQQLGHDDSKAPSALIQQFERTKDLWAKEYTGTKFEKMIIGAPRRGEPSKAYWSGSLSPLRDAPEGGSSFLETDMDYGAECESACSSDMR